MLLLAAAVVAFVLTDIDFGCCRWCRLLLRLPYFCYRSCSFSCRCRYRVVHSSSSFVIVVVAIVIMVVVVVVVVVVVAAVILVVDVVVVVDGCGCG